MDAGHHQLEDRQWRHRHLQRLVDVLPEAVPDSQVWASSAATTLARSFRIFTLSQTDSLFERRMDTRRPGSITGESGQVNAIAVDPSDPSGNTVFVDRCQRRHLENDRLPHEEPGWADLLPLTDFGPSRASTSTASLSSPANNNPNQSIIIAGTGSTTGGEDQTPKTGVGFLISTMAAATWNFTTAASMSMRTATCCRSTSAVRNRDFVGAIANKVLSILS